jgi:plastocyanin
MNKLTSVTIISGILIASLFGSVSALVITNHLKIDSLNSLTSTNPTQTTFSNFNTEQTMKPVQTNQVTIPLQEHHTNNYCDLLHTCIEPAVIQIHVGDRVTWQNKDSIAHHLVHGVPWGITYTSDLDVNMQAGQLGIQEFDTAGTYQYYDDDDPRINGEVIVK